MKTLRKLMFGCLALMVALSMMFVSCSDDDDDDDEEEVIDTRTPLTKPVLSLDADGTTITITNYSTIKAETGFDTFNVLVGGTAVDPQPSIADPAGTFTIAKGDEDKTVTVVAKVASASADTVKDSDASDAVTVAALVKTPLTKPVLSLDADGTTITITNYSTIKAETGFDTFNVLVGGTAVDPQPSIADPAGTFTIAKGDEDKTVTVVAKVAGASADTVKDSDASDAVTVAATGK